MLLDYNKYEKIGKYEEKVLIKETIVDDENLLWQLRLKFIRDHLVKYKYLGSIFYPLYLPLLIWIEKKYIRENEKRVSKVGDFDDRVLSLSKKNLKDIDDALNVFFLGTTDGMRPIFTNRLTQHMSVFGTTGSGKSVRLFQLNKQVLEKGGGSIYVDGKGDKRMLREFIAWAKQFKREEDVLILDFSDPSKNKKVAEFTNAMNIFEIGSTIEVVDFIIDVAIKDSGNEPFFSEQAKRVAQTAGYIVDYMKYKGEKVNLGTFKRALNLKAFAVNLIPPSKDDPNKPDLNWLKANDLLAYAKFWVAKDYQNEAGVMVAEEIKELITLYGEPNLVNPEDYHNNIAEANKAFKEKSLFSDEARKQLGGYSSTYLNAIDRLAKKYPHIFNIPKNDIDFKEIIKEGKLLYIVLPKMDLGQLADTIGGFVVNAIMKAIATSLGRSGNIETVYDKLYNEEIVKSNPNFLVIFDETSEYFKQAKEDIISILKQARSAGVAVVISSQELSSLKGEDSASDVVVDVLLNNTNIKEILGNSDALTIEKVKSIAENAKFIDAKGEEKEVNIQELGAYLNKCKNGLGVVLSHNFSRFLVPFSQPEKKYLERPFDLVR